MDLSCGVLDGITKQARLFVGATGAGAIQGQADEAAVLESLVAFGLVESGGQGEACDFRVHAFGAVGQGVISEGTLQAQFRADRRVRQPFQP